MMEFDERLLTKKHVDAAIDIYVNEKPEHPKARSAFLIYRGLKLPAKFILRLAYKQATGHLPRSETLTGGKASVRVLNSLGYSAIYEKPEARGNRNEIKNERRHALRQILERRFGKVELEKRFPEIDIPDLNNRSIMLPKLVLALCQIESVRGRQVHGQAKRLLSFDFFIPAKNVVIEFDERQHFTLPRAASLRAYPDTQRLGFDKKRWIQLCEEIKAGDNDPEYRDEQRAFYDTIRDLMAPPIGLKPVIRIFETDVHWEKENILSETAKEILNRIE